MNQKMTPIEKYRKDYMPYPFKLKSTQLRFHFTKHNCQVDSVLEFVGNPDYQGDAPNTLVLDGEDLKLISIELDGVTLSIGSYRLVNGQLTIDNVPRQFTLRIQNEIEPQKNTTLNGLYESNRKFVTQCEAEGFRHITFYPDRPDVLSKFSVYIEADQSKYPQLLSNGELIEEGTLDTGRHFALWNDPHPKPSYLFALVAGDLDLLEDHYTTQSGKEVLLQIYVDKGKVNQCHFAMESLKQSMAWDEATYGLEYDLNRYMIVAVSDFNMGAMENKGLNIFNTAYVLAHDKTASDTDFQGVEAVIGHEYFHNWTGNRVTCRDWFQLSLKEGLTVFREQQFSAEMNSPEIQRIDDVNRLRSFQFAEDAGPMAHPIRPDSYIEMNNFYTHTVYIKGAEVIRMLETILGQKAFNMGVRHYLAKHDGQAVTCEDFVIAMEDVSKLDLSQFRLWYSQAGTPELNLLGNWHEDAGEWHLDVDQHCPPTPSQSNKKPFLIPLRLSLFNAHGKKLKINIAASEHSKFRLSEDKKEIVLFITKQRERFIFNQLESNPIPSLLRDFSAPVKLHYHYQIEEQQLLIDSDDDAFSAWEANQVLFLKQFGQILNADSKTTESIDVAIRPIIDAKISTIKRSDRSPELAAVQLDLPSMAYLMETLVPAPVDLLFEGWPIVARKISMHLQDDLLKLVDHCWSKLSEHKRSRKVAAPWRRLFNSAMELLVCSQGASHQEKVIYSYHNTNSITIKQQMLKLMVHYYPDDAEELLESFYDAWQDHELLINKWFSIQASDPSDQSFDRILDLQQHPDFQMTNPNKVRALFQTFAKSNPMQFHHSSGRGYELIAEQVIKLNKLNPQVAARLCGAFNGWRQLDCEARQNMLLEQLKLIVATDNLSPDVFEIANKALLSSEVA